MVSPFLLLLPFSFAQKFTLNQPSLNQRLRVAIFHGQDQFVSQVLPHSPVAILNERGANDGHSVHLLLSGWHAFVESSFSLQNNFSEGCDRFARTLELLLAQGASASQGCPVVDSVHYRNRRAFATLLAHMNSSEIADCLTSPDALGQTMLHVSCKCPTAGSARIFAKIQNALDSASDEQRPRREAEVRSLFAFLGISHLPRWVDGAISREALRDALQPWGLLPILQQAHAASLGSEWLLLRDSRGRSARDYALRSGGAWARLWNESVKASLPPESSCVSEPAASFELSSPSMCTLVREPPCFACAFTCSDGVCTAPSPTPSNGWQHSISRELYDTLALHQFDSQQQTLPVDTLVYSPECHDALWKSLHTDYIAKRRPVLITGVNLSTPLPCDWSLPTVLQRYGNATTSVGSIPYSSTYGLPAERMTIRTFIERFMGDNSTLQRRAGPRGRPAEACEEADRWDLPKYVFDTELPTSHAHHFDFEFLSLMRPPHSPSSERPISLKQFSLGPALSGSTAHWHQTALSVLLQGLKLWLLFPPSHSFWSVVPPFKLLLCRKQQLPYAVVLQRPGEVVYVPDEWGHLVLNVADSVAFAAEFFE